MLGRTLSHYEVKQELSRGGMGVVYRAVDTKLDREVALKVLPSELMADEDRRRRFVLEAKAAAAIHHPHVATIHEIDEVDGMHFIVMELIEGEKLTDLLARGRLEPARVLELAAEMAEGLSKAHDKGVVHRDLKPGNIMVTEDGHIKIIDFGLAKLLQPFRPPSDDGSDAETGLRSETDPGQIMGTVSYMSPEQARGESVDARSDIFSFGILLYEMLSGRLPFKGKTGTDTLSAILRDSAPRLSELDSASELQHVLNRCLAKDPDERYQSAKDLLAELKHLKRDTADTQSGVRAPVAGTPRRGIGVLLGAAALVVILALAIVSFRSGESDTFAPRVGRTIQITRDAGLEMDGAISPDGKMVAYAAGPLGDTKIYVQQVAGGRPVPLTEGFPGGHRVPRWSPDGTRIAFSTRARGNPEMFIVPALGGVPRRFPAEGVDLAWSPDGERIVYADYAVEGAIYSTGVTGDDSRKIASVFRPSLVSWSPDGEHIAYTSGNPMYVGTNDFFLNIAPSSIWLVASAGDEPVRVTEDEYLDFSPVWTPDGNSLLFVSDRGGARDIYRIEVDPSTGPLGEPERLTTGLNVFTIALSSDGRMLSYAVITSRQNLWSISIPDNGAVSVAEARPVTTGNQVIEGVDVSADGKWLVFDSNTSGNQDIYKRPLAGGEAVQLTTNPNLDCCPSWSPDGTEVAFHAYRNGKRDIFVTSSDGGEDRQLTNDRGQGRYPHWSPDGTRIAFQSSRDRTEIYVVSKDGGELAGETPKRLAMGGWPRWSPDGRLIAYDVTGGGVSVIPPEGGESRALTEFGAAPLWSRDGRTIYFRGSRNDERAGIWSVPSSGGEPQVLVRYDDSTRVPIREEWTTDGERFYFALTEYESDVWVMELESSSDVPP